ncbi:hypothetical protein VTL71DRAFT_1249 [Oculimacula yallundae]|uniref:Uncharacterized protein n=1 Tax=Oculimacula yallundae TaxID=86028 RepID=A0ABR4CA56_9HELO
MTNVSVLRPSHIASFSIRENLVADSKDEVQRRKKVKLNIDILVQGLQSQGTIEILDIADNYKARPMPLPGLDELLLKGQRLRHLAFDFITQATDASYILDVLAAAIALHFIEIRMNIYDLALDNLTILNNTDYEGIDWNYDSARSLMRYIHSQRFGPSLKSTLLVCKTSPSPT